MSVQSCRSVTRSAGTSFLGAILLNTPNERQVSPPHPGGLDLRYRVNPQAGAAERRGPYWLGWPS